MGKTSTNILLACTILISCLFYFIQGRKSLVFYGDALGYYLYLPTAFIYNNTGHPETLPTDNGIDPIVTNYVTDMYAQSGKSAKGYFVNQYTYGTAFFELPFFTVAHVIAKLTNGEANGFSKTYSNAIRFSSIAYLLLGLFFLFRSLLLFVDRNTAIITTCIVLIGTNLFWFSFYQSGMAHNLLFFLYALLLFLTIRVHQKPSLLLFVVTGLTAGFISIIRPSDILCLLIPVMYGIYNRASFTEKVQFIRKNAVYIGIAALCFLLPIIPQMLYWKKYGGSFFYDSYVNQKFDFLHPHIFEGLFGFKNGWLAYTPIMFFAFVGLVFAKRFRKVQLLFLTLLPLYIYIIYSWWCYNYINGFGSRPMIHLYPLLAIPLATLINTSTKQIVMQVSLWVLLLFCCFVNIKQSTQQAKREMWSEESNATFNLQTLFKSRLSYNDLVVMDCGDRQPHASSLPAQKSMAEINPYDSIQQKDFIRMSEQEEFAPVSLQYFTAAKDITTSYIKASGTFNAPEQIYDWYRYQLMVLTVTRNGEVLLWKAVKINNKIGLADSSCLKHPRIELRHTDLNQWGPVHFFAPLSFKLQTGDEVKVLVWNLARKPLLIKNLKLELF
ncbi:hypothetical protein [Lacibacter sediminis]|uniref:Glycosyltransferase family 39 protein n=1 Tax=Lacibacter sediminis TaxID=2760713 RepID=A0A7G5XE75_9BACT|nr:hypothetical protein [Lacibacter sediminis]QNA43778.1 hypothetical protein H4075_17090 [Lacibacter sediminis]